MSWKDANIPPDKRTCPVCGGKLTLKDFLWLETRPPETVPTAYHHTCRLGVRP